MQIQVLTKADCEVCLHMATVQVKMHCCIHNWNKFCTGCRQKVGDGQTQPTPAGQQIRTYTDKAGSGDDDFKPTLLSDDARYLRKRKLHMDSMLESAADS